MKNTISIKSYFRFFHEYKRKYRSIINLNKPGAFCFDSMKLCTQLVKIYARQRIVKPDINKALNRAACPAPPPRMPHCFRFTLVHSQHVPASIQARRERTCVSNHTLLLRRCRRLALIHLINANNANISRLKLISCTHFN